VLNERTPRTSEELVQAGRIARRQAREDLCRQLARVSRQRRSRQGQGGTNQVERKITGRQPVVIGKDRLNAKALQLVREPRHVSEQRAHRLEITRAHQMRDEMSDPVEITQRGKVSAADLPKVSNDEVVQFGQAPLVDKTFAQEGAHDVVQAQHTSVEIEFP
jgi:hypothetical protein